jgi:hypothetical protein
LFSATASTKEGCTLLGSKDVTLVSSWDFVGVLEVEMSINMRVVVGERAYRRTGPTAMSAGDEEEEDDEEEEGVEAGRTTCP